MLRRHLAATLLAFLVCGALAPVATAFESSDAPVRVAPEPLDPRLHRVGELVSDLAFVDVDGEKGKLSDYAGNKATVIAIHSVDCPLSKKYTPKLRRLQEEYGDRGVALIVVNPLEGEKAANVERFQEEFEFGDVRYVLDGKRTIARELGVRTTTDVFVLDASRTLRFRGAFDDQYGLGYNLEDARVNYLTDALDAVLRDQRPETQATTAPGCALEIAPYEAPKDSTITYHNRVSRILQQNCQSCHRPGEVGPFPLLSYTDAKKAKGMIKYTVQNRTMPPWFAEGGDHAWGNDASLSDRDREDLLAWIKNGCPEGEKSDAVVSLDWTEGWQIGEPDLVVQVPRVFQVPAEGSIPYKYTKVRLPIEEDQWIQAMEIRPTAAPVVHHVLVLIKYPRRHPKEQPDFGDGLGGYFAVMVPGQGPTVFPDGMAKFLPRGSTLIFQMHYTPMGKQMEDQTKMAFQFADQAPTHEVQTKGVAEVRFQIPPRAGNHPVSATHTFTEDTNMLSMFPHMHLRGKAFRYKLTYPDGREEMLLDIPRYDFNWQLSYKFAEPLRIPKGSKLHVTGWFDNSAENPANPAPDSYVRFGEQTWEEMMIGYFDWYPATS